MMRMSLVAVAIAASAVSAGAGEYGSTGAPCVVGNESAICYPDGTAVGRINVPSGGVAQGTIIKVGQVLAPFGVVIGDTMSWSKTYRSWVIN